jgi:hypothetical protein
VQFLGYQSGFWGVVYLVLTAVKLFALVDAVLRPAPAYQAADKQTKTAWMWILGLTFAVNVLWPAVLGLFFLAGTVAAFVYILDVRPALAAVTRRR